MFTLWFIVAEFVYSVSAGGVPPFYSAHLYHGEFTQTQCIDKLARVRTRPDLYVKAITGDKATWTEVVIIPGWACAPLQVVSPD